MQEGGSAVIQIIRPPEAADVSAFICDAMAREASLACKRPALWGPGAIPTVDFLLQQIGPAVKKMGVKSLDWTGDGAGPAEEATPFIEPLSRP
jgi:hypothetical protein